ncbi:MAG: hypothetical protein ABIC19_00395 [Patescibacteria group bacterium]
MTLIIGTAMALVAGSFLGYTIQKITAQKRNKQAQTKAEKIISDATIEAKDVILKAKEKAVKALSEIKKKKKSAVFNSIKPRSV